VADHPPTTALRGRTEELARIAAVLRTAKETARGAVVGVSGVAGIGKSALLDAAAAHAARTGFAVGAGKAEDNGQVAPMAPLLVALRSGPAPLLSGTTFTDLAPLYDRHVWFVDSLAGAVAERARRTPVLVIVDDLQWADELSLFALRVLPGRLAHAPVVWLLATRPGPADAVTRLVEAAPRDLPVETFELGPLPTEAIEELAVDRLGRTPGREVRDLLADAGGSPFLAVQLLDGLATQSRDTAATPGGLPTGLVDGVRAALAPLPPTALGFVRIGAVLGRSFTLEDAVALTGESSTLAVLSHLEPLIRGGILTDDGREIAFVHDLLRQAVYEDVPPSVRKALHRAAAKRLLETGDHRLLEAAPHVLVSAEAGDAQAVAVLRAAANELAVALPVMAVQLITKAFELLSETDDDWLPVGERAMAIMSRGQYAESTMAVADRLLAHCSTITTTVRLQLRLTRPLWNMGLLRELRRRAEYLLTAPELSDLQRAVLSAQLALALSREDTAGAGKLADEALAEGRRSADTGIQLTARWALGEVARNEGQFATALDHYEQMRMLSRWPYSVNEMLTLLLLDRPGSSARMIEVAQADIRERGGAADLYALRFAQLWQSYHLGELAEAESHALTFLQLCEELEECAFHTEARLVLGRIAYLRGDLTVLRDQLVRLEARPGGDDPTHSALLDVLRFWLAVAEDDPDRAVETARAALSEVPTQLHRCRWEPAWLVEVVRVALATDAIGLADDVAASGRRLAEQNPGVPTAVGVALHLDGLVSGNVDALATAVETLRSSPRPLVLAAALTDYGLALAGHPDAAAAVAEAANLYQAAGAHGAARRVQDVLRPRGARPRRSAAPRKPADGWGALTTAENRVAELVAGGHSNRAAATELFVSPSTVATHLRAVFTKLGVHSRVQLAHAYLTRP
jgi:DNA-binding CsgD family transcriptional regulator/tetratricopeptide (TPR) repeat protein